MVIKIIIQSPGQADATYSFADTGAVARLMFRLWRVFQNNYRLDGQAFAQAVRDQSEFERQAQEQGG